MATIEIGLLKAAQEDGVFDRNLTPSQQVFYKETVVTAFKILDVVRSSGEVSSCYISDRLSLNQNTCKIYCRYLVQVGLLFSTKSRSQGSVIFYKIIDNRQAKE
jgi:hypothetical protein